MAVAVLDVVVVAFLTCMVAPAADRLVVASAAAEIVVDAVMGSLWN